MGRFVSGFLTATLFWAAAAGGFYAARGWEPLGYELVAAADLEIDAEPEIDKDEGPVERRSGRRRRRHRRRRSQQGGNSASGLTSNREVVTGDNLDENGARSIDMNGTGGEALLSGAQIDSGFDAGMSRIRRCFMLAAGDEPIRGRLVFGMRVAGTGRVSAVNLRGPERLTRGDCGQCLRSAARNLRFDSFDGPEMVFHYPITLE